MITNAQPWDNLKFDIDGILEVQRKFLERYIILTHSFLCMPMSMNLTILKKNFHLKTDRDRSLGIVKAALIGTKCR